jgi:RNA polymerase sigma-70 factor (ECF subfamily)
MAGAQRSNDEWLAALATEGPARESALRDLRAWLVRGLGHALAGRSGVGHSHLEDFAHEALLKILAELGSFRGEGRFTTWALTVAVHVAFAELRRQRWQDVSLEQLLQDGPAEPAFAGGAGAGSGTGAEELERRALQQRVLDCLERVIATGLTERQRQALLAEVVHHVPLAEIARRMGSNRNALYKLLHDARQRLGKGLREAGLSPEDIRFALDL